MQIPPLQVTSRSMPPQIDSYDSSRINPGKNYAEYVSYKKEKAEHQFWVKVNNSRTKS
jgi:hypothetical protein